MAAAGLKIVLPGVINDATLPLLQDDSILPVQGAVALFDVAHSVIPASGYIGPASGVPVEGSRLYNVAWKQLAAMRGSGDVSTLSATFKVGGAFAANAATPTGKIERTSKGGIHVVPSQATALASGDGAGVQADAAVLAYIAANPSHSYYLSLWDRYTRINPANPLSSAYTIGAFPGSNGGTSAYVAGFGDSSTWPVNPLGARGALNTLGPACKTVGVSAATGAPAGAQRPDWVTWGAPTATYNAAVLSSRNNKWPAFVFYRMYLEDLTVSGRTYAQVDALDALAYARDVTTAGGRYNGDTFTAAATLLA